MIAPTPQTARLLPALACPASSHIGRTGTNPVAPGHARSSLLDYAPVAHRAGAAFPPFGLRLTDAALSAASNNNLRRGNVRAGGLNHDLLTKSAKLDRRNRAALKPSGIVPDPATHDGRGENRCVADTALLDGDHSRLRLHSASNKLAGASVPALFGGRV